jgi:hypothetical protein
MTSSLPLLVVLAGVSAAVPAAARAGAIDSRLHHLRCGVIPEWSDFPVRPEGASLDLVFHAKRNDNEWALRLRQQDVKQTWRVLLNGKELGQLRPDENDMVVYLSVPPGALETGDNRLLIKQDGQTADDIRVGEIVLFDRPPAQVLAEATVQVTVRERISGGRLVAVPCRITVLDKEGSLMTVGAVSGPGLAVRPGVLYSRDGRASFGLPAGDYMIYAGRGFEYSVDSAHISVHFGDKVCKSLTIHRDVPTDGFVSCDTHIHTLTYSGHGDCTIDERVLTIAGEGIELPIATEHNRQVDYDAAAIQQGVRTYFTPVVGNEVTTSVGHFNVFPVPAGAKLPDASLKQWKPLFASIAENTGASIVVLNHPCDLHLGFRPFGPKHHLALTGKNLDGWELQANGMELINSGAQQTDVMRPYRDWFGLLNRGTLLTPVGASDSHDVSRFLVGQGRTYIQCHNDRPGHIDVEKAVKSFREGRVLVSCGLLVNLKVDDKYGPGDLVPAAGTVRVAVRVLGPDWTTADKVELYANGRKIREAHIVEHKRAGVKWAGEWTLPRLRHDVHLVAIASGPGIRQLYWPVAKPYQPTSPQVERRVIASTGAVWMDGDGDGKWTCAHEYAQRLFKSCQGRWQQLVPVLANYDEAVAAQAAELLQAHGVSMQRPEIHGKAGEVGVHVARGFAAFAEAWRASQLARSQQR